MSVNSSTSGNPIRKGRIIQTIRYGSGRIAGHRDDEVVIEVAPTTYYIWGFDKHGLETIIYTTQDKGWLNEHVRVKKEKNASLNTE